MLLFQSSFFFHIRINFIGDATRKLHTNVMEGQDAKC